MDELTYLRHRAAQEDCAAKMAPSVESQMIHRERSARYARKALALLLAEAEDESDNRRNSARPTMRKRQSWRPSSRHPQQSHRDEARYASVEQENGSATPATFGADTAARCATK
jgi:hypothetical protein